jgi:hypothetical protein
MGKVRNTMVRRRPNYDEDIPLTNRERPSPRSTVNVSLPTVILADGVMRETCRKSTVTVIKQDTPRLYELGVPGLDLTDIGFPWSLDVGQKIPLPSLGTLCRLRTCFG